MSAADIERHDYQPSTRVDRCADCYQPAGHSIHGGRRPAKCRMTGPHNGHAGCAGIDFPESSRHAELLMKYGRAKFGDEWWPGNASAWAEATDQDGQPILTEAEAAELEAY